MERYKVMGLAAASKGRTGREAVKREGRTLKKQGPMRESLRRLRSAGICTTTVPHTPRCSGKHTWLHCVNTQQRRRRTRQ